MIILRSCSKSKHGTTTEKSIELNLCKPICAI